MNLRHLVLAACVVATTSATAATSAGAAPVTSIGAITVTPDDGGFDKFIDLNGDDFTCEDSTGADKKFKTFFEDQASNLAKQQSDWYASGGSSGGARAQWNPVNPSNMPLRCTFTSTDKVTNEASNYKVSNETLGESTLNATCDVERTQVVSFDYNMTFPTTSPDQNVDSQGRQIGLLPVTSASRWNVDLAGFRNCVWSMPFNGGVDTVSGTVEQDFASLPDQKPSVSYNCDGKSNKILCVEYTFTSALFVTGGLGEFLNETGGGTQTETRVLPAVLINMPYEVSGENAVRIQSAAQQARPALGLRESARGLGKKVAPKSSIVLDLKKSKRPSVRIAGPQVTNGGLVLGNGPDGTPVKIKIAGAPKSACGIAGRAGKKSVVLKTAVRDTDGAVVTTLTSSTLQQKLKLSKGAKASLTITCSTGIKASQRTVKKVSILLG